MLKYGSAALRSNACTSCCRNKGSPGACSLRHVDDVYAHLVRDVLQDLNALGVWRLIRHLQEGEEEIE